MTGGNFGIWGGMFSTFDCAVKGWRQKEDAWNAIISGFMTGGCLALRSMFVLVTNSLCRSDHVYAIRWSTYGPKFGHHVWYPSWRLRGRRCSI